MVLEVSYWSVRCRRGCKQPHPLMEAGVRARSGKITQRLYDALVDRYLRGEPLPVLADWSGVGVRALWACLRPELDRRIEQGPDTRDWAGLTHIGLDELLWRGQMLGVVVDLVTGRLIELLPDRELGTVVGCLTELKAHVEGQTGRAWQPVITIDMWANFREAARTVFGPHVRLVADRFHLVAKISEDLQEVARALFPPDRHRAGKLRQLRQDYLRALKTGEVTCPSEQDEVQATLEQAIRVGLAFHHIWNAAPPEDAEQTFFDWIGLQMDTEAVNGHQPFGRVAHLVVLWKDEVLAFHRPDVTLPDGTRPTNAMTENVNGRLRKFEKRSQASRRLKWGGDDDEKAQVQVMFGRFEVRALYAINVAQSVHSTARADLTAQPEACQCGATADKVQWRPSPRGHFWDLPLGPGRVRAALSALSGSCPVCQHQWSVDVPTTGPMTTRLAQALEKQRAQGRLLGRLSQETGPAASTLQKYLGKTVHPSPPAGTFIGIQKWRWRKRPHWLITDIDTGRPLELLANFGKEGLENYLSSPAAQAVEIAFISNPEWRAWLPAQIRAVLDPFSAIRLVQPALQEVQWRFTDRFPVETLRTARFKGHRRVLLEHPQAPLTVHRRRHELTPASRRADFFRDEPRLQEAHDLIQAFRSALWTNSNAHEGLKEWQQRVDMAVTSVRITNRTPLDQSFYFAFKAARKAVDEYGQELVRGARYRPVRSLARSRRALRALKSLEAVDGSNFETLRLAVLNFDPGVHSVPKKTPGTPDPQQELVQTRAVSPSAELTPEQRLVVESPHQVPLTVVVAVAGAGKTRVLTERAEHLIGRGLSASSILFLTFTGAATAELTGRLKPTDSSGALTGRGRITGGCVTRTLHAFCRELIRPEVPVTRSAETSEVQTTLLRELTPRDYGFDTQKALGMAIGRAKQELKIAGVYGGLDSPLFTRPSAALHAALRDYENVRSRRSVSEKSLHLDHDDTLLWALKALNTPTRAVAEKLAKYRVVIVDEYQDVSPLQALILDRTGDGRHLMAVGDPAQSIFGFQGSSPQGLLDLMDRPGTLNFELSENFRSPGQHLMAAAAVLDDRPHLVPATGFRGEFTVRSFGRRDEGYGLLSQQLQTWHGQPVTILVRTNRQVKWVEDVLGHHLLGDVQNLRKPELDTLQRWRDPGCQQLLLPALKALEWDASRTHPLQPAFRYLQIPLTPQDRKWLDQVWYARRHPQAVRAQSLTRSPAVREALAFWQSLLEAAVAGPPATLLNTLAPLLGMVPSSDLKTAREVLRQELSVSRLVQLLTPASAGEGAQVQITTIHKAKGKEFPAVIVLSFQHNLRGRSLTDEEYIEKSWNNPLLWTEESSDGEEKRIMYVALTRSTEKLAVIAHDSSLYLQALSTERQRQAQLFHDLMTFPPSMWTPQHTEALPDLADEAANAAYLERHWWKSAELSTLRQAAETLTAAGQAVPEPWIQVLSGTLHRPPVPVTVKRRTIRDREARPG